MAKTKIENALSALAKEIKNGDKKITFFQGAGISTAAGIPDFRSPKTGLYSNLAKLNLPYAEAVFDIDYFEKTPEPFYILAEELYPGKFLPTKFHYFVKLVQDKGLLKRVYTQNIDTLERIAGVHDKYIVEAHGSFANNHCIDCLKEVSGDIVKECIYNRKEGSRVPLCPDCNGYVKPDIVFFGEGLPEKFFSSWEADANEVEIAIVAGTSLTVYPFASLPSEVNDDAIRVLVNKEIAGDFKVDKRSLDILILKDCEEFVEKICELLGWSSELEKLIENGKKEVMSSRPTLDDKGKERKPGYIDGEFTTNSSKEETDIVEKLNESINKLNI